MDSIPPRSHSFGEQQDSHAFPVKDEYGTFEDHLHLQSSEEEYGGSGAGDQRLSQGMDGQNLTGGDMGSSASGGDGTSSTKAPGGFTSASGSSMGGKDAPPISKRTLQNRKAQREFRQRRATYLKDLEAKVRRYESGEPAGVHPEVQHRINHLVQEIQYLRSIVDRLQQENAELRRADSGYSSHQSLPTPAQTTYTLHPPYPPPPIERSPDAYGSNSLALAEMFQSPYPSVGGSRPQPDGEPSHQAYPYHAPVTHGHQVAPDHSPRHPPIHQSKAPMEWSTIKHPIVDDRPHTASLEGPGTTHLVHSDHPESDSIPSYLYNNAPQEGYYQVANRPVNVQEEGMRSQLPSHPDHHPTSPTLASGSGNAYAHYGHNPPNVPHARHALPPQGLSVPDQSPTWHNQSSSSISFNPSGLTSNEMPEYKYLPHHSHTAYQHDSRSNTHSPAAGARVSSTVG